jgi:polar amino acid transport system substrate-binding protein
MRTPTNSARRFFVAAVCALTLAATGCATSPTDIAARRALAPTGVLRVGVYPGSPSSMVRNAKTGQTSGVAFEFGRALAHDLDVPIEIVEFQRVAQVVDAIKDAKVDVTVTNASPERARVVDFTQPLIQVELGYLAGPHSPVKSLSDVDRPDVRIGVTQGSTSQATLSRQYQHAQLVPAASMEQAKELLRRGDIQAFATNKAILFELSDDLPGYRVLDGRWGLEHLAVAIPKGRDSALPYLNAFAAKVRADGRLKSMIDRAGLRGTASN